MLAANDSRAAGAAPAVESKPPRKWARVLGALLAGRSLNRFEAAREVKDWCLHSTVSELEGKGVRINRAPETVPGAFGPVHCKRYKLDPESIGRARELLGGAV